MVNKRIEPVSRRQPCFCPRRSSCPTRNLCGVIGLEPKAASRRTWTRPSAGLVGVLLLTGLARASLAQQEVPGAKKQVVILYSYRTLMPVNVDWDRGIRTALAAGFQEPIDTDVEYLDLARYEDEEYLRKWIDLLRLKYASRRIDLVIPVYSPALAFTLAHRDTLFPGVPIVFCSARRDMAERAHAMPNVTGVAFQLDFDETLRVARHLCPETERVLVVCGASDRDRGFRVAARRAYGQYERQLDIDYLEGLPLPQLMEKIPNVAPRTVVLMLPYDKDALGNDYTTREVVEKITSVCPAPVFGLYDTLLGHGIIGGSLIPIETQGRLAGQLAARVLQGEPPADIPLVGLATNQLMFDARQLRRWRIRENRLPARAIVRYREATLWTRYGAYIGAGVMIVVMQAVIIAAMIAGRARRLDAQHELADRLRFESILSDLSSRFVHLPTNAVGAEIQHALRRIAKLLDLDGGSLFRVSKDSIYLRASHSWLAEKSAHPATRIRLEAIPWCWSKMVRGAVIHFSTIAELPDEANLEKELFRRIGLKAAIVIPLRVSGTNLGMLALGCLHETRSWDDTTVQRISLIGEIFANALAHARADETLETSRTEARQLAGRLLTAQEDEKRRVARELHDDLSQRLAATAIEAGKLEEQCPESSDSRKSLNALKNALIAISEDVHQLSRRIHPRILDDLGLHDALRSECDGFAQRHGLTVPFRCGELRDAMPKDVSLCLYRIAQEALRNVARHAMVDRVEVALKTDPEFAYLEVSDSGRGFDRDTVQGRLGLGLASMEERVRLVGGELSISSAPGKGTSISVRIPLPEDDA